MQPLPSRLSKPEAAAAQRETYAYGDAHSLEFFHPKAQAVEQLLTEKFTTLALRIYPDKPIVECNVVYCNVLIPGQEVGMHSDVPEFRGVNRLTAPNWLLGVMQHSGLFEEYRVHGVTCVSCENPLPSLCTTRS